MNTSNPVELDASTADLSLDPTAALNQMQGFLKAKDDTSRFVGLAVLKSVLDNQQDLRDDTEKITALWNSISPKFLDRLLRAGQNNNVTTQEAKDMIDIAVSVFHTFAILLPEQARRERRFTGRFAALTNALLHTSVCHFPVNDKHSHHSNKLQVTRHNDTCAARTSHVM